MTSICFFYFSSELLAKVDAALENVTSDMTSQKSTTNHTAVSVSSASTSSMTLPEMAQSPTHGLVKNADTGQPPDGSVGKVMEEVIFWNLKEVRDWNLVASLWFSSADFFILFRFLVYSVCSLIDIFI